MTASILIVEDEILVALEMECILEEQDYQVVGIAADLEGALAYADSHIDLALVDLNLRDGLTGPEIGRRLCEQCKTTVLFITANPGLLGEGIAGTVGVLAKPTCEKDVERAVDYALRIRKGERATPPAGLRAFA